MRRYGRHRTADGSVKHPFMHNEFEKAVRLAPSGFDSWGAI
jgi:hypothetical protein